MEDKLKKKTTFWIVAGLVALFVVAGAGIYAYTKLLKKNTADLLEAVPVDATYVLQVNDNETFVKSISPCFNQLEDFFALDALSGFEFFVDATRRRSTPNEPIVISGHVGENGKQVALLSMKMDESAYHHLLKKLNINPKDYSTFSGQKIYNADTHYKNFKFVYRNGLFSACADRSVLESAIKCLASSASLPNQKDFLSLWDVMRKNTKQNWLVIHHDAFAALQLEQVPESYRNSFQALMQRAQWSAYQIRFTESEMILSGYSLANNDQLAHQYAQQGAETITLPANFLPADIHNYLSLNISNLETYLQNKSVTDSVRVDWEKMNVRGLHLFAWNTDTCDVALAVLKSGDTLSHLMELLPDSSSLDSSVLYRKVSIYPAGVKHFSQILPAPYAETTMQYFIENQGYYIFAESLSAMQRWIDNCTAGKTLDKNQYYLFAKDNLPSDYAYESFYQNMGNMGKGIFPFRIFAYNFKDKIGDLLPNNVYVKFSTN